MNTSIIRYVLGWVMLLEAAFMALPCLVAVLYAEPEGWYFFWVALVEAALALLLVSTKPKSNVFYIREGCVTTAQM